jgi:hypothetical protein
VLVRVQQIAHQAGIDIKRRETAQAIIDEPRASRFGRAPNMAAICAATGAASAVVIGMLGTSVHRQITASGSIAKAAQMRRLVGIEARAGLRMARLTAEGLTPAARASSPTPTQRAAINLARVHLASIGALSTGHGGKAMLSGWVGARLCMGGSPLLLWVLWSG